MAAVTVQASFSAGELSPHLHGRVDLNKYKIGAAKLHNFLVDYKGGAGKRAGTLVVGITKYPGRPDLNVLLVSFQFNINQTYVLEFGNGYIRFITNGGYVLDGGGNIYEVATDYTSENLPLVKWTQSADTLTIVHPYYPVRELIRFSHNNWVLRDVVWGSVVPASPIINIYATLSGHVDAQSAVYVNYAYAVTSVGKDGSESVLGPIVRLIGVLDMTAHRVTVHLHWHPMTEHGVDYYNVYKATAGTDAQHPRGSRMGFLGSSRANYFVDSNITPNFTKTPPINNSPFAPGAIEDAIVTNPGVVGSYGPGTTITVTDATGFGAVLQPIIVGGTVTAIIVENGGQNYSSPSISISGASGVTGTGGAGQALIDPETGGISQINVLSAGSGYTPHVTDVLITDPTGSGALADVAIWEDGTGKIAGFTVFNPGVNYTNPTVHLVSSATANTATAYAVVGPRSGTYPGAVAYFQQRLLFAATLNRPSTLWGSKPGAFHNFDYGTPTTDSDSFEFTLASQQLNAIKYMIGMPGGLVVLTSGGAWQMSGTQQFAPLTPTSVMATPQAFNGCGDLPPITIGYEILFVQSAGSIVRNLSYNFFANIYTGSDVTVLSSHLFVNHKIASWAYTEEPDKVIWLARDDGVLLSYTFLKEQEVSGWARHETSGKVKSVCSVREGIHDVLYLVIDRLNYVTGVYDTFIERMMPRSMLNGIDDAWFLDCALTNPMSQANIPIYSGPLAANMLQVVFYTWMPLFSPGHVGYYLRIANGRYRITQYHSAYAVSAEAVIPMDKKNTFLNEQSQTRYMYPQAGYTWSLSYNVSSVGGLSHLENQLVSVFADGVMQSDKVVSGGAITLDTPASKILVGLGYEADLQTLRFETQPTVQSRRKKIPAITVRVAESRGLKAGMTWETLTDIKERPPSQPLSAPLPLIDGDMRIVMDPLWESDGQICIRSVPGYPANIIAVVQEIVMGDT